MSIMRYYFIIVFLLISILLSGKSKSNAEGYIITTAQDTIYGFFKLKTDKDKKLDFAKTQEKVCFINKGGKKTYYTPGSIKSFHFFYNFETLTFSTVSYFKNGQLFMKVISEKDYLYLYQFYLDNEKRLANAYELAEFAYSSGDFGEKYFFYIIKPDGKILLMGKHTPKNKIFSFFADCPELADKIDSRQYKYTDVYRMVREYNAWKKMSKPPIL